MTRILRPTRTDSKSPLRTALRRVETVIEPLGKNVLAACERLK